MFCLDVLPIVVPTARRLKAQSSLQRLRLLSPAGRFHHFHAFQGFRGGVGRAQKANLESVEKWSSWSPKTGPRTGLEKSILNTLEIVESVEKWSSWSPKTGPRTGLEKSVSNTRKNGAPGHRKQARGRGPSNPNMERLERLGVFKIDFGTSFLGPVFGVQELHFSTLSTLSMLFGVHFWTLLLEPGFGVQELHFSTLSQVGFLGPPNTPLETLESVEMVEATCPAKRPAFEGRWFFLWACRRCNNAKRYDVQPTLRPDHGSQRKARRFCAGLQSRAVNLQASRGSPHAAPLRRQAFAVAAASRAPCSPSTSQSLQRQASHSGCSPRCPQQPLALQPPQALSRCSPGPSQWLQPQMPSAPLSPAASKALTVAAASKPSQSSR